MSDDPSSPPSARRPRRAPGAGDRLVSVVIPTQNAAAHIERTIAAVFDQAPSAGVKLEVVVADEGSTDETAMLACRAGARVILLGGPGGRGLDGSLGSAQSRGAAAALGDDVVFLDSSCAPPAGWLLTVLAEHDRAAAEGPASGEAHGEPPEPS